MFSIEEKKNQTRQEKLIFIEIDTFWFSNQIAYLNYLYMKQYIAVLSKADNRTALYTTWEPLTLTKSHIISPVLSSSPYLTHKNKRTHLSLLNERPNKHSLGKIALVTSGLIAAY